MILKIEITQKYLIWVCNEIKRHALNGNFAKYSKKTFYKVISLNCIGVLRF